MEAGKKVMKEMEWGKGLIVENERGRTMMEKGRHEGFSRHVDNAELNEGLYRRQMSCRTPCCRYARLVYSRSELAHGNEKRKRAGRISYAQSVQLLGNGSVFP